MPITNPDWVPPIAFTFDEGKPIRSGQGLMLAGNVIAQAEGKPGAPGAIGRSFARDNAADPAKRLPPVTVSASDSVLLLQGLPRSFFQSEIEPSIERDVAIYTSYSYNGVVRFKVFQGGDGARTWRAYVNDVEVATSSSSVSFDFNIPLSVNDEIKLTLQTGGAITVTIQPHANIGYVLASAYILNTDI